MGKYIDVGRLQAEIERLKSVLTDPLCSQGNILGQDWVAGGNKMLDEISSVIASLQQEQVDMGEVSDGYHTFNELYYYRMLYNAAFFNLLPKEWVHKSKRHHTGEECFGGGWFIVMANLPTGQVSNHYELKNWDLFKVPEKEFADEWDGHTPQEAAERIHKYLQQEQPGVDVEKEIEDYAYSLPHSTTGSSAYVSDKRLPIARQFGIKHNWSFEYVMEIAMHSYELGLNAKKPEKI